MPKNEYVCDCNVLHEEKVENAIRTMPPIEQIEEVSSFYKIVGDITRCKILFALKSGEMCVCDIANVLSMSKSSVSHQLAKLRENGVVKYKKEGKEVYYSLDDEHIFDIFSVSLQHIQHKRGEKI